jgi:Mg-chelatase subunit ChlD
VKLDFRDHQVALVGTTPSKPFDAPASLAPGQQIPLGNRGRDERRAVGDTLTVGGIPIEESRGDELARATLKEAKGANLSDLKPQETEGVAAGVAVETSSDHFGAFVPAAPPVVNQPQGNTTIRSTLSTDPSVAGKPIESADKDSTKWSLGFPMSNLSGSGLVSANIPQGSGGRGGLGGAVAGATRGGAYALDVVGYSGGKVSEPAAVNGAVTLKQLADAKKRDVENFFKSVTPVGTIDPTSGLPALGRELAREVDQLAAAEPAVETPEFLAKLEDRVAETLNRSPLPVEPEVVTREQAFSTFSLNVSDVSFRLAGASLESGALPDPASIRSEEFINAFDYHDPEPAPGQPIAFAWERARYPFAQNRDVLRFSVKTAAQGRAPGRPLSLVLLLDNSGSMERADRVRIIRESLRVLAAQLQPQDKLSVVSFARTARLWVDGVSGSQAAAALEKMATLSPEGGTNLEEALRTGYETARRHFQPGGINRVVLLTDGAANLGEVTPATLKSLVEDQRRQGVALDCFGIGWEGYNDDLLETLSRNGDGRYGFINSPEAAAADFAGQLAGALQVAASDVKVQVQFNSARVRVFRQIGYVKHQLTKEQFRDNTVDAAEIGAAESGNALYVIETLPQGSGPVATVRVRYKVPGTSDYREQEWVVGYQGNAPALEGAPVALRLAGTAAAFSEWLATNPFAAEVSPDRLLQLLQGIPAQYSSDPRPQRLEWMIRQAKSISSK